MGFQRVWFDMEKKIRVIVADDHALMRQGITSLLRGQPDIEIVGEATDGAQAVAMARRLYPDVILMDINMPIMTGIDATKIICSEQQDTCVIGFSMWDDENFKSSMLDAGAVLFLTKDVTREELIAAIRERRIS